MKLRKCRLLEDENGNGLMLFIVFFFIIVGVAGLVIDTGFLYRTKSELRKTANAAVLSGAQELKISDNSVKAVINKILEANGAEDTLKEVLIRPNSENKVTVTLKKDVPLHFMRLFNIISMPVSVTSSAAIAPITRGVGAVPFGIDKSNPLEYMKEYTLKVDAGGSEYGNFGILALSGPGATLYEQDLMYGYKSELKVGDIVETQTGNIEGKTRNGINYRINASPYPENDITHRDDPRILMILVYEPYKIKGNQLESVKICGFAYFYLKKPMNKNDSSVVGYFIQKVGTGIGDVNSPDNGAYAIRLVE